VCTSNNDDLVLAFLCIAGCEVEDTGHQQTGTITTAVIKTLPLLLGKVVELVQTSLSLLCLPTHGCLAVTSGSLTDADN
jgi:hypothetical protein